MSMYYCSICDKLRDSDFIETVELKGELICDYHEEADEIIETAEDDRYAKSIEQQLFDKFGIDVDEEEDV